MRSNCRSTCCQKVGIKKGPWTHEEDEILRSYIEKEGQGRWRMLPENAGLLRCGKSCRLRWMNYLRPNVKRGLITVEEEQLILRLHRLLGNRWSLIAKKIPGRTDNEIKNYWNTHLSKKLISQGVDPRTHTTLEPVPDPSQIYCMDSTIAISDPSYHNPCELGLNQWISGYDATTCPEQSQAHGFNQHTININHLQIVNQPSMRAKDGHDNYLQSYKNYYSNEEGTAATYGSHENHYGNEVSISDKTYQKSEGVDVFDYSNNERTFTLFLNTLMNEDTIESRQEFDHPDDGASGNQSKILRSQ